MLPVHPFIPCPPQPRMPLWFLAALSLSSPLAASPSSNLVEALLLQGALLPSPSLGSPAEERGCAHKAMTALPPHPASVMPPFLQPLPWCKTSSPPAGTPTTSATPASFLPFQPIPLLLPQGLCSFWPVCLKSSASLSGYSLSCAWGDVYAPQSPEICFLVSCWSHFLSYSELIPFFLKFYYLSLWLRWVFAAAHELSAVAASGGCPLVAVCGLPTVVASPVAERWLPVRRLQCLQHAGSAAVAHGL